MAMEPEEQMNEDEPEKTSKSKILKIGGIIAASAIFWAGGIFIAVRIAGPPPPEEALAIELEDEGHDDAYIADSAETAEILITKLSCPHTGTSRFYLIDMEVYALVPKSLLGGAGEEGTEGGGGGKNSPGAKKGEGEAPAGIEAEIHDNIAAIRNKMRTIIASADPGTLCLPMGGKADYSLSTLRRQFKTVLEDFIGKGKIKEVLIPNYMPRPID